MKLEPSCPSPRGVQGGGEELRFRKETGGIGEVEVAALKVAAFDVAAPPFIVPHRSLCGREPVSLCPTPIGELKLR